MSEARGLARRLAAGPTLSYANSKRALNNSVMRIMDEQLDLEADIQGEMARQRRLHRGQSRPSSRSASPASRAPRSARPLPYMWPIARLMGPATRCATARRAVRLLVVLRALRPPCALAARGPLAGAALADAITPDAGPTKNAVDIDTLYKIVFYIGAGRDRAGLGRPLLLALPVPAPPRPETPADPRQRAARAGLDARRRPRSWW